MTKGKVILIMRVMVTIDGVPSVHEILEFKPQEDGSVLLVTNEENVDLVVFDMQEEDIAIACKNLLKLGYTDLSLFETEYDEIFEDVDEDEDELYSAICPECESYFEFEATSDVIESAQIGCPYCNAKITVDGKNNIIPFVNYDEDDED